MTTVSSLFCVLHAQVRSISKAIVASAVILSVVFNTPLIPTHAIDISKEYFLANQVYNNLIPDEVFIDINSMDTAAIQSFLETKDSPLKSFSENGRSAAQIIYDAAHGKYEAGGDWGGISINTTTGTISPRLILVYLEKEQSLISRDDLPENVLRKAVGYQCYPGVANDNNGNYCNDRYEGFTLQVENAAWQLRYNYEYAKRGIKPTGYATHYIVGEQTQIPEEWKYGGKLYDVTIGNGATGSIYSYTPYIFDSAYNCWKIFHNWFSDAPAPTPAPAPEPPAVPNDTAAFSLKTYIGSITVGGTKSADARVFFNGQLIQDAGPTSWQLTFESGEGAKTYTVEYQDASGTAIATKPIEITRHRAADINGDGRVDIQDLSVLAHYWGQDHPAEPLANLNQGEDEVVDILDLSIMAGNWNG